MTQYLLVPGLGNSGPEHWQTFFENSGDNFQRVQQQEWEAPDCGLWIENIDKKIAEFDPATVVLVGHSLGCTAIAHWAGVYQRNIKGAMLVAPSDIEAPAYVFPSTGFAPVPLEKLPFKTLVVASEDDAWVSLERARLFADSWGSEFVNIGKAGHINTASGHYRWQEGLELLERLT